MLRCQEVLHFWVGFLQIKLKLLRNSHNQSPSMEQKRNALEQPVIKTTSYFHVSDLSGFKVQMTKIYISVSSLQLLRHYFKDHTTENRMQKFQLVPEI